MQRVDSLEKTLMLRGIGGRRTKDEMAGWHHWLYGSNSEWTPGVCDWQGGLACCNSWDHKESDMTEWLNWTCFVTYIQISPPIILNTKDLDVGRDWGQEKKGMTVDEMAGWHHWLDGCESEWIPGVGDGQGGLACCNSWGRKELDTTEWLNWTSVEVISPLLPRPKLYLTKDRLTGENKILIHMYGNPIYMIGSKTPSTSEIQR